MKFLENVKNDTNISCDISQIHNAQLNYGKFKRHD